MSAQRIGKRLPDRLLAPIAQHRGWALVGVAGVLLPGLAATLLAPPQFEATATLLMSPAPRGDHACGPEATGTIAALLRTRGAAADIVAALALVSPDRLDHSGDWRGRVAARVAALRDAAAPVRHPHAGDALLDAVVARIRVTPVPDSDVLRVGFRAADAALAQQAANALVWGFLRSRAPEAAMIARAEAALPALRAEAAAAAAALDHFRATGGDAAAMRREPLAEAVERLGVGLAEATAQRQQQDATAQTLRERLRGWVPYRAATLRSLNEAEVAMVGLDAQIAALRSTLADRLAELEALAPLDSQRRALEAAAAAARDRLAAQEATLREAHAGAAAAAAQRRDIRILDLAAYPTVPIGPQRWPGIALSLLGALLAMLALPLLAQRRRGDALAAEADTARRLGLTFVATVPRVRDWQGWPRPATLPASGRGADAP